MQEGSLLMQGIPLLKRPRGEPERPVAPIDRVESRQCQPRSESEVQVEMHKKHNQPTAQRKVA